MTATKHIDDDVLNNYIAIAAPGVTDDASAGYSPGSLWVDNVGAEFYVCVDNTVDTAVWSSGGGIHDIVEDLTPELGGPLDTNDFQVKWSKGADVASGTALPVLADGNYFDVTGTNAITSINTMGIGTLICLHFDGILILTHNATDLILPSGANITTAAGDEAIFVEYASGDWRCVSYSPASGYAVKQLEATEIISGVSERATDDETVTGTATDKVTTPANITAKMAAPGAIGGTTPAAGNFTNINSNAQLDAAGSTLAKAMSGDIVLECDPATAGTSATVLNAAAAGTFTKNIVINLKDAAAALHKWASLAVSAATSEVIVDVDVAAPAVSDATPDLANGTVTVVLTYDTDANVTKTYAIGDTVTLTISQPTGGILGYPIANATFVDTIIA